MKKLPNSLDGPIDNLIIDVVDYTNPFFYSISFTPNGITTLSLLSGLLSAGQIGLGNYWSAAVFYFLSYYFDCADGYMARTYKMVSTFGDYYDHIKDLLIGGIIIYMLWCKYTQYDIAVQCIMLIVTLVLLYMCFVYLGCQEMYYNHGNESATLNSTTMVCPIDKSKSKSSEESQTIDVLSNIRYFSPATLTLWICFMIVMCGYFDRQINI
jgi:phosphatidylglycerophosphate synthase